MRQFHAIGWAALLTVLLALTPATQAQQAADVIKQVPAESPLFISVPNLASLSKKLAMLDQKLELNRPELGDTLSFIKAMGNMTKGVDDNGSLALVLLAVPDPNAGEPPPAVVLVPVSDYAAFVSNFEGAAAEGVANVNLMGQPAFVKKSGKYAVLSPDQGVVEKFKAAEGDNGFVKRAGALGGRTLAGSDLLLYVDVARLAPTVLPQIEAGLAQAKAQMQNNPGVPNAEMAATFIDLYGDVFRSLFRDGESAVIGVSLSEKGVGISNSVQFKTDSPLGKAFAKAPAGDLSLSRLPSRPFMFAMTMDMSTLPMKQWVAQLATKFQGADAFGALMAQSLKMFESMGDRMQQAMYPPNLAGGMPSLFTSVAVYETDKPAQLVSSYEQMLLDLGKLNLEGMTYKTGYQANAKQIAGKRVDSFTMQMNLPPDKMAEMGPMAGLFLQPMNGHIVPLDKGVVVTQGADEALLTEAVNVAGGTGKLGDTVGLAAVRSELPKHRFMETYVGVGTIMQMASSLLMMFAPQLAVQVPADLPPVAVSASAASGGANLHYQVPMDVIVTVKNVVQKLTPQAPGAGGPNPGAAAPAAPAKPLSQNVLKAGDDNFDAVVMKSAQPVLVEFWADWVSACRQQGETSSAIADELSGKVKVVRVDVNSAAAEKHQVEVVPTLLVVKNGKVVQKFQGLTPKAPLMAALK